MADEDEPFCEALIGSKSGPVPCGYPREAHYEGIGHKFQIGESEDLYPDFEIPPDRRDGRPTWDERGLELAKAVALRADCSRRQVGAVLMGVDRRIIATGYNGAPSGDVGCLSGGCPRALSGVEPNSSYDSGAGVCIAIHAEQNVIIHATYSEMMGAVLYVTHRPCDGCARMIAGTPIARVVTP